MYAWLPLAEPEARPLRRAVGALLRELDDTPPDDVTDIPELQVTTQWFWKSNECNSRAHAFAYTWRGSGSAIGGS